MEERPYSIRKRFAFIAAPAYLLIIALVTTALNQTFQNTALKGQRERLEAVVYSALGSLIFRKEGKEIDINEATFSVPGIFDTDSELGLLILDENGKSLWSSRSQKLLEDYPFAPSAIGEWTFEEVASTMGEAFALRFAVDWEGAHDASRLLYIVALQTQSQFKFQQAGFRKTLWISVLLASFALGLALFFLFHWGMRPLTRFEGELTEVRSGEREALTKHYPVELQTLKESVNLLLEKERTQSKRIGNLLDDLAHGLKTPLTVLRSRFSKDDGREELHELHRIEESLNFYVKKARSSQRLVFQKPIPIRPILDRLKTALEKANARDGLEIELEVDPTFEAQLSETDLFEMFGNLLENAAKYGRGEISVSSDVGPDFFKIHVEDNGPGFDLNKREELLQRGFRADESKEGSGIGLHLVAEIAHDYGIGLDLGNSRNGGARVSLLFHKNS